MRASSAVLIAAALLTACDSPSAPAPTDTTEPVGETMLPKQLAHN